MQEIHRPEPLPLCQGPGPACGRCVSPSPSRGLGHTGLWTEEAIEAQRVTCWGHQPVGSAPGRSLGPSDFQHQAVSVGKPRTASSRRWHFSWVRREKRHSGQGALPACPLPLAFSPGTCCAESAAPHPHLAGPPPLPAARGVLLSRLRTPPRPSPLLGAAPSPLGAHSVTPAALKHLLLYPGPAI